MNKATAIFFSIIVLSVIFVLGAGSGVFYQTQKNAPQKNANQIMSAVIKELSSKVVPAITAYGQVAKIEGRNITLNYGGDNLTVKVGNNAQIYSYTAASTSKDGATIPGVQKTATFNDIKKGDSVSVNLKLLSDNTLQGNSVIILPPPTQSK